MRGKLITFEGCEGSGKSTQVKLIEKELQARNIDYILAREPGGTSVSEKIREIILDKNNENLTSECEALLYASARCQLLIEVIIPALNSGKYVILDRYIDSSFAYQAYARGLGFDFIEKINSFAIENCMPDVTIFFDITPENAFARKGGADKNDRLELAGMGFHKRVYNGYLELKKKYPNRFIAIESSGTIEKIHEKVVSVLEQNGCI